VLEDFDDPGSTPLHWAVTSDSASAVTSLLRKGANPSTRNKSGYAALHLAVQLNSVQALQALIDAKVCIAYICVAFASVKS